MEKNTRIKNMFDFNVKFKVELTILRLEVSMKSQYKEARSNPCMT